MKKQRTINTRFSYPLVMLLSAFGVQQISAATTGVQVKSSDGSALTAVNIATFDHKHSVTGIVAADLDATVQSKILSTYAAGEQLSITGTNEGGATPVAPFTYFAPGSVILWQDKAKHGKWQCVLDSEPHLDMKGGTLYLETDIRLKGDGRFDSLGIIKTSSTGSFFANAKERSISLSEYETIFPRGVAGFVDSSGSSTNAIPTVVVCTKRFSDDADLSGLTPTDSHIPVSCDWGNLSTFGSAESEYIFSVSTDGSLGQIWASKITMSGSPSTITGTSGVRRIVAVNTTIAGEGKYTSIRVAPNVDQEKQEMFVAVSRLNKGSTNTLNCLQFYRFNPANGTLTEQLYKGIFMPEPSANGQFTPPTPVDTLFNGTDAGMNVYAVAWRPVGSSGPNGGSSGGPGGQQQLAVTYSRTVNSVKKYFVSVFGFFYDGFTATYMLMENGRAELIPLTSAGIRPSGVNYVAGTDGLPLANQLSWKKDGSQLVTIVQDITGTGTNTNIQVFEVMGGGYIASETEMESDGSGGFRPKLDANNFPIQKPRVVSVVYSKASAVAFNPTINQQGESFIAVTAKTATDNLKIYKLTRGGAADFSGQMKGQLSSINSQIDVSGAGTIYGIIDMDWDPRGMTLALACEQNETDATTKSQTGGVRLYTFDQNGIKQGNPLTDFGDGAGTDAQGTCKSVRYNKFGDKFARGSALGATTRLGVHHLQTAGGQGQDALFENIALILNSDISFNASVRIFGNPSRLLIKGNGHILTFTDLGRITIPANTTLYLKDITIKGVKSNDVLMPTTNQVERVINNIIFENATSSTLVLDNAKIVPDVDGAKFLRGTINLMPGGELGGEGKKISIQTADASGTGGMTINQNVTAFSGRPPMQGFTDFGKNMVMQGNMDFRGAGFTGTTAVDAGGHTVQFDARSYPSTTVLNMDRTQMIPIPLAPGSSDVFDYVVTSLDLTNDVELPFVCAAHKGDGSSDQGRISVGIVNPFSQQFVKGASVTSGLTTVDGQVADVAFRKAVPLVVTSGANSYDRYFMAVLRTGAPTLNAGVQMYAIDIDHAFYKTETSGQGIYSATTAADYNSLRTSSYMTIKAPGDGNGSLLVPLGARILFTSNEQAKAIAMSPDGKKLAVIVQNITPTPNTYALKIYGVNDTGLIETTTTKVLSVACAKPGTKTRPLKWTADGKFLVYSSLNNDNTGRLQTFIKKDTIVELVSDFTTLGYVCTVAPHPFDSKLVAVAQDGAAGFRGIKIYTLDETGKAQESSGKAANLPTITFNDLEWNPDGNLIMAATTTGVMKASFNMTNGDFLDVMAGDAARMELGRDVKALKFTSNGATLIRGGRKVPTGGDAQESLMTQTFPVKDRGGFANGTMDVQNHLAIGAKTDISGNTEMQMNRKNLDIPSTGEIKIASGVTLTIKQGRLKGLRTRRKAIDNGVGGKKMVNELASIKMADSTSKLVLDECELELVGDADFVTAGKVEIKTKDAVIIGGALNIPKEGSTKIASDAGLTMVADAGSLSAVSIAKENNTIDTSKQASSSNLAEQKIKTEATLGLVALQASSEGQQRKNSFDRSADGTRTPLILQGSTDATAPTKYPMKDYMELSGSGQGDITVQGYVQLDGPTTTQDANKGNLTDNTVLKVADGAKLLIKSGGGLTCTGQMSIVADKGGSVVVQNGASIVLGTADTKTNDKVGLIGNGGEIELQGSTAQIASSYGQNKIVMNPGSSIDATAGGEILINQTLTGVVTSGAGTNSRLTEFTLDKAKIAGPASSNDPIIYIAPNDTVGGAEVSTTLAVANVQNTGNTNMAFTKANANAALPGTDAKAATLNDFDQAGSLKVAQLVENLTVDNKVKSDQAINPVRTDAQDIPQVTSIIDPLFKYDVRATDKLETVQRYTTVSGQEVVTGTDAKGKAFRQVKDGQRVS